MKKLILALLIPIILYVRNFIKTVEDYQINFQSIVNNVLGKSKLIVINSYYNGPKYIFIIVRIGKDNNDMTALKNIISNILIINSIHKDVEIVKFNFFTNHKIINKESANIAFNYN